MSTNRAVTLVVVPSAGRCKKSLRTPDGGDPRNALDCFNMFEHVVVIPMTEYLALKEATSQFG